MNEITFHRLRLLFDELVALPPVRRASAVASRGDLDERTRRRLLELLEVDTEVSDLTARSATPALQRAQMPRVGGRIGAYLIDAVLGEGGMGSVYRARRDGTDIEQWVAIKVARRELLDEGTLARFRVERQVLALLQHPQIAAMYDVGELADGTPYIVMEYVQGRPLLEDADARGLGLRERLELFLLLCDAVSYAHRNLIVHRDIKPGNVLVSADGRPKLLDFGIAKPLNPQLGAVAIEHTLASQRYFSLRNAAPEQLRDGAIGVTCDVYGLGSVLYELLCGRPLYDFDDRTFAEIERSILEDDPEAPSRRLVANAATPAWRRRLPRDLDAVALRALRRDPRTRYQSVDELAADIRRYLTGFPVSAAEAPWHYRFRRLVRRHRIAFGAGALLLLLTAAGAAIWLIQYTSTLEERTRADSTARMVTDAIDRLVPHGVHRDDIAVTELLSDFSVFARIRKNQPRTQVHLLTMSAHIEHLLGRPAHALELLQEAKPNLALASAELREEHAAALADSLIAVGAIEEAEIIIGQHRATTKERFEPARWLLLDAVANTERGNLKQALKSLDTMLQPWYVTPYRLRNEAANRRAVLLARSGQSQMALAAAAENIKRTPGVSIDTGIDAIAIYHIAQEVATEVGEFDLAAEWSARSLAVCHNTYEQDDHFNCIDAAGRHALVLADAGRYEESYTVARNALALSSANHHGNGKLLAHLNFVAGEVLRRRKSPAASAFLAEAVRLAKEEFEPAREIPMQYEAALIIASLEQGDRFSARRHLNETYFYGEDRLPAYTLKTPRVSAKISNPRKADTRLSPQGTVLYLLERILDRKFGQNPTCGANAELVFKFVDRKFMDRTMRVLLDDTEELARQSSPLTPIWMRSQRWTRN